MNQDIIKRIIELSEFDNQNDAHDMQYHLEEINELALLLQAKVEARAIAAGFVDEWGNKDWRDTGEMGG